jgi:hypothetical protein
MTEKAPAIPLVAGAFLWAKWGGHPRVRQIRQLALKTLVFPVFSGSLACF